MLVYILVSLSDRTNIIRYTVVGLLSKEHTDFESEDRYFFPDSIIAYTYTCAVRLMYPEFYFFVYFN